MDWGSLWTWFWDWVSTWQKHGNADTLSRFPNPRGCSCPPVEENEPPYKSCKKCLKRAELMWQKSQGSPQLSMYNPMVRAVRHQEPHQLAQIPIKGQMSAKNSDWSRVLSEWPCPSFPKQWWVKQTFSCYCQTAERGSPCWWTKPPKTQLMCKPTFIDKIPGQRVKQKM